MVEHRPLLSSSSAYRDHVYRTIDRLDQIDRELAIARGEREEVGEEKKEEEKEEGGRGEIVERGVTRRKGYFEEERKLLLERLEGRDHSLYSNNRNTSEFI